MMPPSFSTGSSLDGFLPATAPAPTRERTQEGIQNARKIAAGMLTDTEGFFAVVRTRTHEQLDDLAHVINTEFPNRINERLKKEIVERLAVLRKQVRETTSTEDALRTIEDRLGAVLELLKRPLATTAPVTPVAPVVPPAPEAPSFLTDFFGGITSRVMTMFSGRPATAQEAAKVEAQTKALSSNIATAGERILDGLIASPEALARIPVIGTALAAPINIIGSLMGSTPESRRDRAARREAERAFRGALAGSNVLCANPNFDDVTWNALKAVQPPRPVTVLLQEWVKAQRDTGITTQLVLNSPMELLNLDGLRKQLADKRVTDQRNALITSIGGRIGRPVSSITNGSDVQAQIGTGGVAITARIGDLSAPPLSATPGGISPAPLTAPAAARDFDDTGNPVTAEAKTLVGAMRKFPNAVKIRIGASGSPMEMTAANEFTIPAGSFDETGVAQTNEARTLVGMSVRFRNATKLKLTNPSGGGYELANATEYTALPGGFAENGNPSTNDARQFETAIRTLTGATKITVVQRGNPEILNGNEFTIRAGSTRVSLGDMQALARLENDRDISQIIFDAGLPQDIPMVEWRDNVIHVGGNAESVAKIVAAGSWNAVLANSSVGRRINLNTMRPISST